MPFRKWVMVGFAIGVGLLLCGAAVLLLVGLGSGLGQMMGEIARSMPAPKPQQTKEDLQAIVDALSRFRSDVQRYPTDAEGLAVLCQRPEKLPAWNGPYLPRIFTIFERIDRRERNEKDPPNPCATKFVDPWGNPYQYRAPTKSYRDYDLFSYGADGVAESEGGAKDLTAFSIL